MENRANRGLRLVGFDVGGIRSLSQLNIMGTLIHRIQYDLYPDDPDKIVLPCECFDMMGGSDTGGIIAVMLSRLRMSVEDATEEFFKICNEVYIEGLSAIERTNRLRSSIEDILRQKELPLDLKLGRDARVPEDGCPCFVVAIPATNMETRIKLRSYRIRTEPASNITVVEAILATCATQPRFSSITIGPILDRKELVGGAMGAGNPCRELISEGYGLFGKDARVSTILSIGSVRLGSLSAPLTGESEHLADLLSGVMRTCEQVAQEMEAQVGHLGLYYRLSVEQGIQRIYGIEVAEIGRLNAQVHSYLEDAQVSRKIDHCIESLRLRQGQVTLGQLKHTTGNLPIYKDMPSLTTYFVMRQVAWDEMVQVLLDGDVGMREQRVMVISGMGGCGKTQLIVRFTKEYKNKFKYTFFVDGSSKDSIQADIINHARTANIAYSQATFDDAINFFCNPNNCPWMLVYDNVDDINLDLSSLMPECNFGIIVITTRNQARGQLAAPHNLHLKLDVMSTEEAVEVVFLSANIERTEQATMSARTIAKELGNLPIALVQAGSYIQQTECSCEEYLAQLRMYTAKMMYMPAGDRLHRSAYTAFDLSYQRLQPHTRNFLHIMGYLHFAAFPMEAIKVAAKTNFAFDQFNLVEHDGEFEESVDILKRTFCPGEFWDEFILNSMVTELKNYSLASFTRSTTSLLLRMHPLMHQWTLVHLPNDKQASLLRAASRLLACSSTEITLHQYLTSHIDTILLHSSESPINQGDKAAFGYVLTEMQREKDSQIIWQDIYDSMVRNHGNQDARVATAAMGLATTFGEDLERMEELEKEAIAIRERVLGPVDLDTLDAKADLAGTYLRQGRLKDAEELQLDTLEKMRERLGLTHAKVIEAMGWLGQIYTSQGRYLEAEQLQAQVLETWKKRLGDAHPDSILAMGILASTYQSQGRYHDAELLQDQVLKKRKERMGDIHPDTLLAMHNLASTYQLQGRYSDAEFLQSQVLKIRKERLGSSHPDTLLAMHNLASTYQSQSRYSDAEPLQIQVLNTWKERLGSAHADTLLAMDLLASTYCFQRRYIQARTLQETVLEELQTLRGANHTDTAIAMHNLAWTYYCLGQLTPAKVLATQAERVQREMQGNDYPEYIETSNLLERINEALAR